MYIFFNMDARDFKYGNWIFALGKDWEITAINKKTVTARHAISDFVYENQTIKFCHIKPIPLSETWLNYFNAKIAVPYLLTTQMAQKSDAVYFTVAGICFYSIKNKYYVSIGESGYSDNENRYLNYAPKIEFEYVHEFQNIFYLSKKINNIKNKSDEI